MDRRYAGRATGVGHCKVLGRIPARHVYFLLGNDGDVSCKSNGSEQSESSVQMDGPALTVLEGTVTKGVDMLLGLDVLQDWDAEIRMGSSKSITVRKREGRSKHGSSVVIPFVNQHGKHSTAARTKERHHGDHSRVHSHQSRARQSSYSARSASEHGHQIHGNSMATQFHRRHHETASYEDDSDYFSPTASDIESDLDLLEKTNHDDDLEEDMDSEILPRDFDNESLNGQDNMGEEDENDDYLEDVEEDANEAHFDMSGL